MAETAFYEYAKFAIAGVALILACTNGLLYLILLELRKLRK